MANRLGEPAAVACPDRDAAIEPPNDRADIALRIADVDHRPAYRRDAVKLARHHQALGLRTQANQVQVRRAEALRKRLAWLIVHEAEIQLAPPCFGPELARPHAAADEYESNPAAGAKELRGAEDRFVFVDAAHVAGVGDDKTVAEPPLAAQSILFWRRRQQGRPIGPIWDHAQPLLRDPALAQYFAHGVAHDYIGLRRRKRPVAQPLYQPPQATAEKPDADSANHLGENILQP